VPRRETATHHFDDGFHELGRTAHVLDASVADHERFIVGLRFQLAQQARLPHASFSPDDHALIAQLFEHRRHETVSTNDLVMREIPTRVDREWCQ
jgi:hypothetical protein